MRTLFGNWDVVCQNYYVDGEWRRHEMPGMCMVEFSVRWGRTIEIGGVVYHAEFPDRNRVILHNPDDTVRIELGRYW